MGTKEILLQVRDASVQYGGVAALDRVNISLDEGEIVALMGPNGAGKSTVLKSIFGLAPLSGGAVLWHEKAFSPVPHQVVQMGISFVPQGRRVFSRLTVQENLEMGAFALKDQSLLLVRIQEVLDLFPALAKKRGQKAGSLSGGEQQMLALARGLMTDPRVLLLDEPSLGLAPKVVSEVFAKIREVNEKHTTAIMVVEHNIRSLLTIATRAYVLDKGRVVAEDTAARIEKSGILERVFLGKG